MGSVRTCDATDGCTGLTVAIVPTDAPGGPNLRDYCLACFDEKKPVDAFRPGAKKKPTK